MYKGKKIVVIIPARGGSKSIPRKNIKLLNGKPLISYAINAAKGSKYVDRVIVSTDDKEISSVAKKCKAEVPFVRPAELANDVVPMLPVVQHTVSYLEKEEKYHSDIVILIHLTSPFLTSEDIDEGIEAIIKTNANSCATICKVNHRPEFILMPDKKRLKFKPFMKVKNIMNTRRQDFKPLFRLTGAFYINKRDVLMKNNIILDLENLAGIIIPDERAIDIDEPLDFIIAETVSRFNKKRP